MNHKEAVDFHTNHLELIKSGAMVIRDPEKPDPEAVIRSLKNLERMCNKSQAKFVRRAIKLVSG